jgi:hypothetical protein
MSYEYDDYEDFFSADADPHGDGDYDPSYDVDDIDDSMDGDFDSAMRDAGFGTDEDYGCYGEDLDYQEDFHADEAVGFVDYNEDGPYDD